MLLPNTISRFTFGSLEYFNDQLMQGCENAPDFFSLNSEVVVQFQRINSHSEVSGDIKVNWFGNLSKAYEFILENEVQGEIEEHD